MRGKVRRAVRTHSVHGRELAPVDRVAARVTAPAPTWTALGNQLHMPRWEAPPPIVPIPEGAEDLTGTVRTRMRVVGYLGEGRLLVRCACGYYEYRKSSSWKRSLLRGKGDACQECRNRDHLRRCAVRDSTGEWKEHDYETSGTVSTRAVSLTAEQARALSLHRQAPRALAVKHTPFGRAQRDLIALGLLAQVEQGSVLFGLTKAAADLKA